ncbi:ribosome small subunit-dependent GTPase A [Candidatus Fermentibacterales bacterium]|nr:ribosome small subunit-dependent GTPase A [Candidatus Fermentibacterales bacterium]
MSGSSGAARVASVGRRGLLVLRSGREEPAVPSGSLMRGTRPVVGDRVLLRESHGRLIVEEVLPRGPCLSRTLRGGAKKILAANVDRVMIVVSVAAPPFRRAVIDRIAAAAEWQRLRTCVVLNKMDLAGDAGVPEAELRQYELAGYPVSRISCLTGDGLEGLLSLVRGSTVVMAGHSGVGKTSLAKRLAPGLDLRVAAVSERSGRGRQTTTAARLVPLAKQTFLVDTPGFRVFSVGHIPGEELDACFPEMRPFLGACRFRDCLHLSEPECAVKDAVGRGVIPLARYEAYVTMMSDTGDETGEG